MLFQSFLISLEILIVSVVPFAFHHQFYRTINDFRLRKHPLPYVFPAIRAFLLPDQTLIDALFAERMTTDSRATAQDVIHADRTIQLVNIFK